jgi:hypothetical protein
MTVQDWTAVISTCANVFLVSGLWIAYYQIRTDRHRGRVQSTLEAQSLLVSGEVGAARRRLGDFSYRLGLEKAMGPRMVRPTWEDLENGLQGSREAVKREQLGEDLLSDLFLFARAFRRISIQIEYGLLDPELAFDLFAWEAVYWDVFFSRIDVTKVEPLVAVKQLARWGWIIACQRGLACGELTDAVSQLNQGQVLDTSWRWLRDLGTDFAQRPTTTRVHPVIGGWSESIQKASEQADTPRNFRQALGISRSRRRSTRRAR